MFMRAVVDRGDPALARRPQASFTHSVLASGVHARDSAPIDFATGPGRVFAKPRAIEFHMRQCVSTKPGTTTQSLLSRSGTSGVAIDGAMTEVVPIK